MTELPVADVKRAFSDVLKAAERGERTIVLRRGRPVAVIGPLDREQDGGRRRARPQPRKPGGLLAVAGLLEDWETIDQDMADVIALRQQAIDRPTPTLE